MKHVAVLFEFPTLNGGEHSMLAVLEQLQQQADFRLTALAPATGLLAEEFSRLKIPHVEFSVRDQSETKRPTTELLPQLNDIVSELCPDIVHANSLSMSRLLGQMGAGNIPFQRTGHLRDIIRLKKQVISDLNNNDALVAVSRATREFHVAQGLNQLRCQVIHNGVDTDQFQPRDPSRSRAELLPQIPADSMILLSVGQICLRKGQLDVAKAVCDLLTHRNDVHLVVVGQRHSAKAESVEYEQQIQREFQVAGRQHHLHLLGHRHDISRLMNSADLLVHAAYQEPFGRVLLEAAASGLPILATDVGGTAEMLEPTDEAMLIPAGDSTTLRQAMERMLMDVAQRKSLAAAARRRVVNQFSLNAASTQLAEFWLMQALGY